MIERSLELVRRRRLLHRRDGREILADREDILVREIGVRGVRECRVQVLALVVDALVHGPEELRIAPAADAALLVRGDVRGIKSAEVGDERTAARERLAVLGRMAGLAISRLREVAPARYGIGIGEVRRHTRRVTAEIRQLYGLPGCERHRAGTDDRPRKHQ